MCLGVSWGGDGAGASVAPAILNNHVLVMPQSQIIVLKVQHGEGAEARWHAGRAGHSFWVVMFQEALKMK